MTRFPRLCAAPAALLALTACASGTGPLAVYRDRTVPIASVAALDPVRFQGDWVEIARYPTPFEAGCWGTRASYALRPDGVLSVVNQCRDGGPDGALRRITGTATPDGPGRFSVRLEGVPVAAPYWVLWVDGDYQTAAVGVPSGRAGWILHRDADIPPGDLRVAREVLRLNGYDLSRLATVGQPSDAP